MLVALVAWTYIALMLSLSQWPDIGAMVITFVVLGGLPLGFVVLMLARGSKLGDIRHRQRARRDNNAKDDSV
jgi:hypothetical protein